MIANKKYWQPKKRDQKATDSDATLKSIFVENGSKLQSILNYGITIFVYVPKCLVSRLVVHVITQYLMIRFIGID